MSDNLSAELQHHVDDFEAAKTTVQALVEGLSDEQLNWRSDEKAWSILECIDHLYKVGAEMLVPMKKEMAAGRGAGKLSDGPFKYGFFGNLFQKSAGPITDKNKLTGKSPKLYAPSSSDLSKDELISNFIQLQDDLIEITKESSGLNLKSIRVTSPAISFIRFSLGVWLKMLPGHQQRHFQQAQRVRDQLPQS